MERDSRAFIGLELVQEDGVVFTVLNISAEVVHPRHQGKPYPEPSERFVKLTCASSQPP